jgi:hypothetical protein
MEGGVGIVVVVGAWESVVTEWTLSLSMVVWPCLREFTFSQSMDKIMIFVDFGFNNPVSVLGSHPFEPSLHKS